jgi:integrase
VFKLAWRDQVLKVNPLEGVEGLPLEDEELDPFALDEIEIVLAKLEKISGPEVRDYFDFAFFTGLRPSEQIELKWSKFDERSRTIRIDRSRVRGKAKTADATKFKTSSIAKRGTKTHHDRDVKLNARALAVLKRQKARSMLKGEHVFLNPATGAQWNDSNKQGDIWRAAMRLTKLRYRTQYQTRSTYASIMLTAGMRPAVCARLLGHSLQVFFTQYAKLLDDKKLEASEMNKL